MAMKCTRCGTLLVPGSVSCPSCGLQFATPVPQDPAAAPAAPQAAPPPQPQYGAPPQYGSPPQQGPAPQYGTPPPQYGTPPPYGANQPYGAPPYGQAPKKGVPVWLWIVVVVVLGLIGELSQIGKNHPSPPAPAPAPAPTPSPTPEPAPTPSPAPTAGGGDANALAANMTKFGHDLQDFGAINGKPQFDDPAWQQRMEQNVQAIKDDIAAEKQISWPDRFLPAKANYEGGLAEYEFLADHWVDAVEHTDTATLKECDAHAEHGNELLAAAEKQIKDISGSS
jgi:hypothetical protein